MKNPQDPELHNKGKRVVIDVVAFGVALALTVALGSLFISLIIGVLLALVWTATDDF